MTDDEEFSAYLNQAGYTDVRIRGDKYVCIVRMMFTHAIIRGRIGDTYGYDDRWCYHDYARAKVALDAWTTFPEGEPDGWHRHPDSGRRRDENGREYVQP